MTATGTPHTVAVTTGQALVALVVGYLALDNLLGLVAGALRFR
ncbi:MULTISPECIES: hypothetical protein [Salinibaculum]